MPTQNNAVGLTQDSTLADAARAYAANGWYVFPVKPRDKTPIIPGGFRSASNDIVTVGRWWSEYPKANIGLAPTPSGLLVIDIDSEGALLAAEALALRSVETLRVRTGRDDFDGCHLYFEDPGGELGNLRIGLQSGCLIRVDGKMPAVEVKASAGYVLAPPSIHPTGRVYRFENPDCPIAPLPEQATRAFRSLYPLQRPLVAALNSPRSRQADSSAASTSLDECSRWLMLLSEERCDNYADWLRVLMAVHHEFANTPDEGSALELVDEWSRNSSKYQPNEVGTKWKSFGNAAQSADVTIRSLRHWATEDSAQASKLSIIDCSIASDAGLTLPTWRAIDAQNSPEPLTFFASSGLCGLRRRGDSTLAISPFTQDTLAQHLASKVGDFQRQTKSGTRPCYPPPELIRHLLANPEPPVPLPWIERVVPVPIFASSGELLTTPGYHPASRTYYAPPALLAELRPVSPRPTSDEVNAAVRVFDEHVGCNFPFADDAGASRAHALALALQGFVMEVVDAIAPLYDIEAAQRRTGKGLLAECCLMPAFGPALASKRTAMPTADAEMQKVLTAQFREGGLLMAFDNVKGTVDFPAFEAALTTEHFEGRILGTSSLVSAKNRLTWLMISNNPDMSGDLAGRAIRIRLISPVEYPEDRTDFTHLQPAHTRDQLPELIWALQTLVQNWFVVGCPDPAIAVPGLGSYARWRQVLGGILEAAHIPGFLANRQVLRQQASRGEDQWRQFIQAWQKTRGTSPVQTSELLQLAEDEGIEIRGDNDRAKATSLGMRLGKAAGVRYFDRFSVESGKTAGQRHWKLEDHGVTM